MHPAESVRHDTTCRICGSDALSPALALTPTPLEDQFVTADRLSTAQPTYPLNVSLCEACGYLHLPDVVNPELTYPDYIYRTGVTLGLSKEYDEHAWQLAKMFGLPQGSLAIDVGSNDGSMLGALRKVGFAILGIEPSRDAAKAANERGLTTINDFFSDDVVGKINDQFGSASLVTANYMLANVDDVRQFCASVARVLAPDGLFCVQTGYHPEQMKRLMFDYIYHEHFSYFTVKVLSHLFALSGLELIHAEASTAKGGSIRVVAQLTGAGRPVDHTIATYLANEEKEEVHAIQTYYRFEKAISQRRDRTRDELLKIKRSGRAIAGFGASHSTTTLLYHFGLGEFIEFLVDDNPMKHGRFSPGLHLPVYPSQYLQDSGVTRTVLLAWQYTDAILARQKAYLVGGGTFLIPLPEVRWVG